MINLKIYAILALIITGMGVGFKFYWDYSQEQMQILAANIAKADAQIAAQQEAFNTYKVTITKQSENLKELNSKILDVEVETSKLSRTLARHELDRLAGDKPGLIEIKANKATAKVFENLEEISKPVGDK